MRLNSTPITDTIVMKNLITNGLQLSGSYFPLLKPYTWQISDELCSDLKMSEQQEILGVVGGVGPSATVDFLDKIIRDTL